MEHPFAEDEHSPVDDICKTLQEKGVIHTAFAEYNVITELSKIGRKWCYESYATCHGKKIDALILPPEHGSSKTVEAEEGPPTGFVKRASRKHLELCRNVQGLIKEEARKKGEQKKRKIIQFLVIMLLLALFAGGTYFFIFLQPSKEKRSFDSTIGKQPVLSPDSPQLILEYSTIRGKVEPDPHGIPTIILEKTDVVTVNVIDPDTGEIITQGVINIKLVEEP